MMSDNILGNNLIRLDSVDSTNDYAKNLLASNGNSLNGVVIIANKQTSGRGQRDNLWESEPGLNITCSVVLNNDLMTVQNSFFLSVFISLAIADTLNNFGEGFMIKWPNDIYYNTHQKIGGILIENSLMGPQIVYSVIGIGINVNQTNFTSTAPNPVSLKNIFHNDFNTEDILKMLLENLNLRYKQIERGSFNDLMKDYYKHLYLYKECHQFNTATSTINGSICGVDESGRLLIEEKTTGKIYGYYFKEIEFPRLYF